MMKGKPRKIETPNCINIWPVPDGEDIEDIAGLINSDVKRF